MRKARIGVIGCGWWATRAHLPSLAADPRARIAAIADPDEGNRSRAAERFGVPADRCYPSAAAMLDAVELDGVIVAVPHVQHEPMARLVLERGIHLLIEKPMTIRPEDARALARLAGARSVEILVGYGWQYNAQTLALRKAIAAGAIGRLEFVVCQYASMVRELYRGQPEPYREILGYPVNAPGSRTYADPLIAGGGQGQTQTTHAIALVMWVTGLRPAEVSAMTGQFELEVDLVDAAAIRFEGGALGSLGSTGSILAGQEETLIIRIYGSDGHVEWDVNGGEAAIHGREGIIERLPSLPLVDRFPELAPASNLVGVALGTEENRSPGWVGVLAVEFLDAMYRSAADGRAVRL